MARLVEGGIRVKGIYVAVASLLLAVVLAYCFTVGATSALPVPVYIWQTLGIILACCIGGVWLVDWARRFFYMGRPPLVAVRESFEGLLAVLWRHGATIVAGILVWLVAAATIFGAVVTVTKVREYYVLATTAQATIDSLQNDVAAAEAKLQELESRVKKLTDENEALLATVKKAARAGVTPNRGGVSRSAVGRYLGRFECTAYNPVAWQCDSAPHITAAGNRVQPGYTAAVDPRYYKLGTRFYVSGFGEVVADDTGSKVLGPRRLDICVQDLRFARELGRWWADVWLVE